MRIDQLEVGTVQVLSPQGPLVDDDVKTFLEVVRKKLSCGKGRVVLELGSVPYVDSEGLEALLEATESLGRGGCRLKLASVTSTCRETLELTGLACRFQIFEEVQDAVRSFL